VYAHTAVICAAISSMLFTTLAITFKTGWLDILAFSTDAVYGRWELWRILSYAVWNPPSIDFAIQMLMLWWFGREIEGFFGRRTFGQLFLGMLLVPVLTALAIAQIPALGPSAVSGLSGVSVSLQFLVAYATLCPNMSFFYGIPIKWIAGAVVGVFALTTIANHDWTRLVLDTAAVGFSFGFVRNRMGLLELPSLRLPRWGRRQTPPTFVVVKQRTSALQPLPTPASSETSTARRSARVRHDSAEERAEQSVAIRAVESIDPLLEKISRSGMDSLTSDERAQLMEAREALLRQSAPEERR
jgi:membrane associated rhomboid family serine protease